MTIDLGSGVVVPIERLSVWVVSRTRVPSSVHPEGVPPESSSEPQVIYPRALVSRTEVPEQPRRLLILIPVAVSIPPANVEVAVEEALSWPWIFTVPVAIRFARVRFPEINPLPWTERSWAGEVVPTPTFVAEIVGSFRTIGAPTK